MGRNQLTILRLSFGITDLGLLNTCLFLACYLSNKYSAHYYEHLTIINLLPVNALWILSTRLFKLYDQFTIYKLEDIYKATWRSILSFLIAFQLYSAITASPGFPTEFQVTFTILTVLSYTLSRITFNIFEDLFDFDFNGRSVSVLAIASVGGHWIELLRLMPLLKEHDVTFMSTKSTSAQLIEGYKFYKVPEANKDTKLNLIKCTLVVTMRIMMIRPRVIISTGAAPGLIGIVIGKLLGIKTVWIDSVANVEKLSLSGRIAAWVADRVYTQWEHLSTPRITFNGSILS